jgi:uncharacterized membrane protein
MSEHDESRPDRKKSLERLIFFSDGVFAIAITLLILDIGVPDVPAANGAPDLALAVRDLGPSLFAYVLSFLVIGLYWQAHRDIFSHLVRDDTVLTWLNLIYLMFVAFLPFPTAMRGDYPDARFAVVFYAGVHVVIGIVSSAMWIYATRGHRLIRPGMPESAIQSGLVNGLIPPIVFLVSIGVAYIDVELAPLVWIALAFTDPIRSAITRLRHRE